ncbi:flippase [Gracilimonas amylolytica]|uniref:flippase n=1 Tax=Gracilimonas amylolytica TaxID=1749045 RepID=UPI0018E484D6|nr:flippase [Gracilimonas amylolytica]
METLFRKFKDLLETSEVRKYTLNTSWMMGEKILAIALTMVTSIIVARYLGPEKFGILSYAISLSSLFAIATHMGLSGLAVRELVNKPKETPELMGSIFGVKFIGAMIAFTGYLVFINLFSDKSSTEFWVLILVSVTIFLKPFEVFDYWFQAKVKAKYSSIVRSVSITAVSILKIILVITSAGLLEIAATYVVQTVIVITLFTYFFIKKADIQIRNWSFNINKVKELLGEGWMLMLGAIFAMVYLKIDQIMLRWIVGADEVGIYSVAARISEAWYFIPTIIVSSIFPKLLELKKENPEKFHRRLQQLFNFLFLIALGLAILISFISTPLIETLYGLEYQKAAIILSIHIWAGVFIFMRAAFSKWVLVEDAVAFSLITQGLGALVNIILNIILIPYFQGFGAAVATICSYSMASYIALLFYKKSRPVFWMMTKAIFSPFLILKK